MVCHMAKELCNYLVWFIIARNNICLFALRYSIHPVCIPSVRFVLFWCVFKFLVYLVFSSYFKGVTSEIYSIIIYIYIYALGGLFFRFVKAPSRLHRWLGSWAIIWFLKSHQEEQSHDRTKILDNYLSIYVLKSHHLGAHRVLRTTRLIGQHVCSRFMTKIILQNTPRALKSIIYE